MNDMMEVLNSEPHIPDVTTAESAIKELDERCDLISKYLKYTKYTPLASRGVF